MAFTQVTVTHDYDLPSAVGALGVVEFTPIAAMNNAAKTVSGTRRATLAADGTISITLDATTNPGTWPTGVRYRVVERLVGLPASTFYVDVPHDRGSPLDLYTLIPGGAVGGSGGGSGPPVTLTASGGVITPNAGVGSVFRHTATADVTVANPTGGSDGQIIHLQILASGGDRTLTFANGAPSVVVPSGTWWTAEMEFLGGSTWLVAPLGGGGSGYSPVALTASSGVITPNAALGYGPHRYTATSDVTLADPVNGSNGQPLEVQILASGADRLLTVAGSTVTVPSGSWWWGHFSYLGSSTWLLDDSGGGTSGGGSGGAVASVNSRTGVVVLTASDVGAQPADADLTALAGLGDGLPIRAGGSWSVASGTRDGTRYLRDDGTWSVVSAGSGTGAGVLYSRGVNMAGAEFAGDNAHLPGTYSTDYSYDSSAGYAGVAARGHKIVRLPFRWERIQPTRNAALNSAELSRLTAAVAAINAAGMTAVLDVHNYARFIVSGGATLVLGTDFPVADLVDLWTRLSTAFKGNPGIYAYGLMNEPHDLAPVSGSYSGTVRYDWASGVQGWTGDTATASNVSGALRLTSSLGSGTVNMRKDDAATVQGGASVTGNVLRVKATPVALPAGTWTAKAQWQTNAFAWQDPTSTVLTKVSDGTVVTSLTVGVAVYVTCTFSGISSPPKAFALQVDGTGATAGTVTVDFNDFSQGSTPGAKTAAQVWEDAAQQCVTAIRNNGDTAKIMVAGYNWAGAQGWPSTHPAPFITDPSNNFAYEAHYYFDGNNSGIYSASYTTENAAAVSAGYASLTARAQTELSRWTTWLDTYKVPGFLGELGWPNDADTASWNAVGDAVYQILDAHNVDATIWSGGARWGTTYKLSVYTGTAQDVVKSQATVVEAHKTAFRDTQGQITALTSRVSALENTSGPRSAPPHRGPAYMVIDATTATDMTTAKNAGATHALVQVFWDQCQSTSGGAVNATAPLAQIANALNLGLKVCLRVSLQYIPAFVDSAAVKFRKNGAVDWNPGNAAGSNARDWVWSASTRGLVKDFLSKLFVQLDWSKIERVQLGGLVFGELSYPVSDGTVWWGFSSPAQTGTDLAPRMAVCPVPGYTPSTGTTWNNNDMLFVGWYAQSLINWMKWLIEQHRTYFSGPMYVMHPGFGLRSYMDPTGSSALAYREMNANGLQWLQQIGAYPDSNIHPYSTWIDAQHSGAQPYSTVNDGDAAPWLHLVKVARQVGRGGRPWGENSSATWTNTDMNRVFQTDAIAHGYEGLVVLNHAGLASGSAATYANLATRITAAS